MRQIKDVKKARNARTRKITADLHAVIVELATQPKPLPMLDAIGELAKTLRFFAELDWSLEPDGTPAARSRS